MLEVSSEIRHKFWSHLCINCVLQHWILNETTTDNSYKIVKSKASKNTWSILCIGRILVTVSTHMYIGFMFCCEVSTKFKHGKSSNLAKFKHKYIIIDIILIFLLRNIAQCKVVKSNAKWSISVGLCQKFYPNSKMLSRILSFASGQEAEGAKFLKPKGPVETSGTSQPSSSLVPAVRLAQIKNQFIYISI